MSEPIPAEIRIGGKVPASLAEGLLQAIDDDGAMLDWGGCRILRKTDDFLRLLAEDSEKKRHLQLCHADANYGEFPALERFLQAHRIPYDRHNDAKYEYDGKRVMHRPGMAAPAVFHASQNDEILVPASELALLVALLSVNLTASTAAVVVQNRIEAASRLSHLLGLNIPELPPFEIVSAAATA